MSRFRVLDGLRARVPAMLVAVLTLASPLAAVPSAQAAALQTLSLSAPSSAETRIAFTLSGYGAPVKAGRTVVVQRLSGTSWIEVARTTESSTGRYAVSATVSTAGKFTYRAVALSWLGAAAVASVSRVVAVHVPYILLTPSTAIAAETVRATGTLPGVYSRPVWVQRKYGTSWLTMVKTTTTTKGTYSTAFRAPAVASYAVRSLAPKVTISGKVRAQYVTAAKTLKVVAQSAALSLPVTLVQARTGVATVSFAPVRAGRGVALQILKAGVWTTVATSTQSGNGTRSFTITAGTPASYSYRAWTAAAAGAPAFASAAKVLKVIPPPVTSATATSNSSTSVTLSWANPAMVSVTGVRIRRAVGAVAPTSPTAGTQVVDVSKPVTSYTNTGLTPGTQYSYALFAHTGTATWLYSTPASAAAITVPGPVTALTAVPASTTVALSWVNPTGVSLTGVMIRRLPGATAPASPTAGVLVRDALATSFTDTGLTPGTQYSYAVFAHNGTPRYAAAATATTITVPGPVTTVTAVPGSTSMALSWANPVAGSLAGVMIRRSAGASAPASPTDGELAGQASAPATSFTDTSLEPETQYSYALFAHNGTPRYAAAATWTASTVLGQVTGLSVDPTTTSIALSWDNPTAASLSGVMIRRSAGATAPASTTDGVELVDADFPATSFTDTGLTPGTQYSYALFAHDGVPVFATAATVTSNTISGPVTDVVAVPALTSIALSWANPLAGSLTGVLIRRLPGATPPVSVVDGYPVGDAAAPATTFTDTGLTPGAQYSYALFAHDGTPLYAVAATVTSTTRPGPVTSLVADPAAASVALSWTNPPAASLTGVMIRRSVGTVAPTSPTDGDLVGNPPSPENTFTDSDVALLPETRYSYALFAHDGTPLYSSAATVGATTTINANRVSTGYSHSCALTVGGGVKCWGSNASGVLGDGTTALSLVPVDVSGLGTGSGATAVAAGMHHTCALTSVGGVKCWGQNAYGGLGDGTTDDSAVPVDVLGLGSGVTAISAGSGYTCAVTSAGGVMCWGYNFHGELGNTSNLNSSAPVEVTGLGSGMSSVSAGGSHTCALTAAGDAKCWGLNSDGELGNGTTDSASSPVDVSGLGSGVTAISAGWYHTCAVISTGGVRCWGDSGSGKLGDGERIEDSTLPVDVTGLDSGAVAVAAGESHTCAVAAGGVVRCWGYNGYGQLGDGTTDTAAVPVDVLGVVSGAAVSAGGNTSCAVTSAGAASCWGLGGGGELGNGTAETSAVPVDVVGLG